ncbi:DUF1833 family protein [Rhodoligotrophos ferricapiens]|uniref:DUF1833 family protein n=1 Tax=Rhodoligotrophos ferricapiens TaxID=3069264 RepID=UPI00315DD2CB
MADDLLWSNNVLGESNVFDVDTLPELDEMVGDQELAYSRLLLLTITHSPLAEPIRVVNGRENVMSRGEEFLAFAFHLERPSDSEGTPSGRLVIANTDRRIGDTIKSISGPVSVKIEYVLASAPDEVQLAYDHFELVNVTATTTRVEGDLIQQRLTSNPWPWQRVTQARFPSLFR